MGGVLGLSGGPQMSVSGLDLGVLTTGARFFFWRRHVAIRAAR